MDRQTVVILIDKLYVDKETEFQRSYCKISEQDRNRK